MLVQVRLALPNAVVCEGISQLSCPHTLGTVSPVPSPSGQAPLCCPDRVHFLNAPDRPTFLSTTVNEGTGIALLLSCLKTPGPALPDTAGGQPGRGRASPLQPCHLISKEWQVVGQLSLALSSRLAHLFLLDQGQHYCVAGEGQGQLSRAPYPVRGWASRAWPLDIHSSF